MSFSGPLGGYYHIPIWSDFHNSFNNNFIIHK